MADTTSPAYEVTATRRRPGTFGELAGQEFVVSTLTNSLRDGKIAHAYLFSGPRGCGKTSAARILARSLNCERGPAAGPCGTCDSCRAIRSGSSMDVIEIDGASNTSVNDVRQIKDEVLFPPQAGTYKIYIIDEVHMLSNSAFNALLKTIEEPPPYIVFIFATTELHKVPATIKSRCQHFNFRLIPVETIQGILREVCDETGTKAEDNALFWIAKESTGSMRDAFTLFDQVASFSAGHIREDLIREKLGLAGLQTINRLAEACVRGDASGAFGIVDSSLCSGVSIEQLVVDLAGYYRSLMLIKNGVTRESLLGYGLGEFSTSVLEALDPVRLEKALEILLDCYRDIRYSVSPRFELETAVSKLSWLQNWVSPEELKAAVDGARAVLLGASGASVQGGLSGPFVQGGRRTPDVPPSPGGGGHKPKAGAESGVDGEPSPFSEIRRMFAERKSDVKPVGGAGGSVRGDDDDSADDGADDEPAWSGMLRKNAAAVPEKVENESTVDRVLRMIPGTIVN